MKEADKKKDKNFSLHARGESFKYAFDGIKSFFKEEHNARIHLLGTIAVIFLCFVLPVSGLEAAALILSAGFVWSAEIFNTVIEKIMDFIEPEKNSKVKLIKDLSAAAVLIAAAAALATGCIIFIPKILKYAIS